MPHFVQLTTSDCSYLLELINDMDAETRYTEKQRSYTIPKLKRIQQDPGSTRLAYQDVEYLLDLIEDDDLEDTLEIKENVRSTLLEIQNLQNARYEETRDREYQREMRRSKRIQSTRA